MVAYPLAREFSETLALDLHELDNNLYYAHFIDHFTRLSGSAIIRSKDPGIVLNKFLQHWVSLYGSPRKVLSDNGGEFNNEQFRDMAESSDIQVMTTAAESPWSNGLCERHNAILTEILLKIKEESACDLNTALSWAIMAKNCLHNVSGFSPYQLVYGRNLNLPLVVTDTPPALEGTSISKYVTNHMEALHVPREAFVKVESSEKIRRALRRQILPSGTTFDTGDLVYYKCNSSDKWKGPGHVIGQDGQQVFVRHTGTYVRIHPCHLMKCSDADLSAADLAINETTGQDSEKDVAVDTIIHEPDSDDSFIQETFNDSSQLAPVDTTDLFDNDIYSNLNSALLQANEVSVRND